ncbi:YhhA family cyclophane-containing RiPP [Candidatus Methylobacter oryzae]|uniref:YhhA family cyclophane-containing RiPP n=1 Tax=Candidatus Methylobacter oryzae TaxID=2497749 RepID=UPI003BA84AAD
MQSPSPSLQGSSVRHNMPSDVQVVSVTSPTLARLIEEVKNDNQSTLYAYDRVHNRHNR